MSRGGRRVLFSLACLGLGAFALPGCGDGQQPPATPPACLGLASAWVTALESAGDGPVLIEGRTPISDCLPEGQSPDELQRVGWTATVVASSLAGGQRKGTRGEDLRRDLGQEAFEAGYLAGAIEAGAGGSGGEDELEALVERVRSQASRHLESRPPEVREAFEDGLAAGREKG